MTGDPPWWLAADWPASAAVRAGITTRGGGVSAPPYAQFNLADHVGDDADAVHANRARLGRGLGLPSDPFWLRQQHGARVVAAAGADKRPADGCHASLPGQVCAVLVADCVPLLLADAAGTQVAAVHAGWRGIAAGVIDAGIAAMRAPAGRLLAWIGPCIGPANYEVRTDMRDACLGADPGATACFDPAAPGRWRADLPALVRRRLRAHGVTAVYSAGLCTHARGDLFYSHRRDGRTGRMAALIWINDRST
jgi:hypothetical protein